MEEVYMMQNSKQITNIDLLWLAMTKLAIKDYRDILKCRKPFKEEKVLTKEEIEAFFMSPEYEYVTGYNGKKIVCWLKKHTLKNEKIRKRGKKI